MASFGPQRPPTVPPEVGLDAERAVTEEWRSQVLAAQHAAVASLGLDASATETLAVVAPAVEDAVTGLGWDDGDLLVVGASAMGAAPACCSATPPPRSCAPPPSRSSSPPATSRSDPVNVG